MNLSNLPSNVPRNSNWAILNQSQISNKISTTIKPNELEFGDVLGNGSFGEVFKGRWRKSDVAIKQVKAALLIDQKALNEFWREAEIVSHLRPHANIVSFFGVCTEPLCIVLEFMSKGALSRYLENKENIIDEKRELHWMLEIATGMHHLALEGIVHSDLAARNVLLTNDLTAKVGDFGLSRQIEPGSVHQTQASIGPIRWMSPEALSKRIYSEKSDVWAWAVTCVEIATRKQPYPELDMIHVAVEVMTNKKIPTIPKNLNEEIQKLLLFCFTYEADVRPNFEYVLSQMRNIMKKE